MSDDGYSLDEYVNHTGRSRYDVEKYLEIPYVVVEQ